MTADQIIAGLSALPAHERRAVLAKVHEHFEQVETDVLRAEHRRRVGATLAESIGTDHYRLTHTASGRVLEARAVASRRWRKELSDVKLWEISEGGQHLGVIEASLLINVRSRVTSFCEDQTLSCR